jgi:CRISPR-associated protein Cmr5
MPDTTTLRGIEQGRANQAFEFVNDVKTNKADSWDEYKSGVRKLPVLIKTNGLGQALAFIKNRKNFPKIYDQLADWLQEKDQKHLVPQEGELVQQVIQMPSATYRQVTVETLALLMWMRRFVDGLDEK